MLPESTPTTNTYSKKVFFSCNDALATTLAGLLVPHGRVHCGNVNPVTSGMWEVTYKLHG